MGCCTSRFLSPIPSCMKSVSSIPSRWYFVLIVITAVHHISVLGRRGTLTPELSHGSDAGLRLIAIGSLLAQPKQTIQPPRRPAKGVEPMGSSDASIAVYFSNRLLCNRCLLLHQQSVICLWRGLSAEATARDQTHDPWRISP